MDIRTQVRHCFCDRFHMLIINARYDNGINLGGDTTFCQAVHRFQLFFQQHFKTAFHMIHMFIGPYPRINLFSHHRIHRIDSDGHMADIQFL